jgi:hypothetical protein
LVLVAISQSATGQVTASISGTTKDASGASMSGVAVTLKSLETGATRAVTSGDLGDFRARSLRQPFSLTQRFSASGGTPAMLSVTVPLANGIGTSPAPQRTRGRGGRSTAVYPISSSN